MRMVGYGFSGVEPEVMGFGPIGYELALRALRERLKAAPRRRGKP